MPRYCNYLNEYNWFNKKATTKNTIDVVGIKGNMLNLRQNTVDKYKIMGNEYSFVLNTIQDHWDYSQYGHYEEHEDIIRDWVQENVCFNFPYEHFLKQDVKVNIIVNTGDGNYDYTLNNFASYNAAPNVEQKNIGG